MKSDFSGLKRKIFFQMLLVLLITAAVGLFFYKFFIDGFLQEPFADGFVSFCTKVLCMDEGTALRTYEQIFMNNKIVWVMIGFGILALLVFYFTMSRYTRYLEQIGGELNRLLDDSTEPIRLLPELGATEEQLNAVKRTLAQRKWEAAESERRKNEMVLYLAHDIKTPLTSVLGYLGLLEQQPDMPQTQREEYVEIALRKSKRLSELVDEFFEITRFNFHDETLELERVSLPLLLEQLTAEFYPMFEQKSLQVTLKMEEEIWIMADSNKLARVFGNVLKNAVSYSDAGGHIAVTVRVIEQKAVVTVENTGPDIPPEELEHIFQKFYRVDAARSGNTGGAGLGLAISKEIVQLHGGKISAASKDGVTAISVTLPLASPEKGEDKPILLPERVEKER